MLFLKNVFLADDDSDDVDFFTEALNDICESCCLNVSGNGIELLDAIEKSLQVPDIIFIDINMPLMDGMEALSAIRGNTALNEVPSIIYSTSSNDAEIRQAHAKGASFYFIKPCDFNKLKDQIRKFLLFDWKHQTPLRIDQFAITA